MNKLYIMLLQYCNLQLFLKSAKMKVEPTSGLFYYVVHK